MKKGNTGNTVILVVDDEEADLSLAADALDREGYIVLSAATLQDGLKMFRARAGAVDLLIADVSLPDGNGCDLALAIGGLDRGVRVLFVSGHVGAEVCRFYGLDVGDLHFLKKPFTGAMLVSRVRQVLAAEPFPVSNMARVRKSGNSA